MGFPGVKTRPWAGRPAGDAYRRPLPHPSLSSARLFIGRRASVPCAEGQVWLDPVPKDTSGGKKMRCLVVSGRLRLLLASAALLALGVVGVGPAHAQVLYGTLVGEVTDSTRAGVPGAAVTITHKETNLSREATTDTSGTFRFVNLPPGTYTVKVSMTGF